MDTFENYYENFIDFVYKKTGIRFEQKKEYFVERRIKERMDLLGIESYREYLFLLKYSSDPSEFNELVNRLTINETYFFRDFPQLRGFAESLLPYVLKEKEKQREKSLKLWSAGCSTGEEPYTLAIILKEMIPDLANWNIKILASDINHKVLETARRGYYNTRSIKDVPLEYLERYFSQRGSHYIVSNEIKDMVEFCYLNLNDDQAMAKQREFDFIFCRNVLIYFDDESRTKVLNHFYRALRKGGFIILGHSESVGRFSDAFTLKRLDENIFYCKA